MATDFVAGGSVPPLLEAWSALQRVDPGIGARAAALSLGVSEAEVVAACAAMGQATRLQPKPAALLGHIASLGAVRAQTASRHAILESIGTYGIPDIGEHTGIVIGENIDLRIFPSGWHVAYAVTGEAAGAPEHSVQVFDEAGAATHKIFLGPGSNQSVYERLGRELAFGDDASPLVLAPAAAHPERADAEIDAGAYRSAFAAMQDTHDFFMLLRRFGIAREQGLRLADPAFARLLVRDAHRQLFARATAAQIPLMLFVANEGMVHISSGLVPAAVDTERQYTLGDARFRLQLAEDGVARAWAVRKPTSNGIVTSLELYDAAGTLVLQIFGERHEGAGERPDWARAMAALPSPT